MNLFKTNPVFASALSACALLAAGALWCIHERRADAGAAAATLEQKKAELRAMSALEPAPSSANAAAVEADLARTRAALAAMEAELKGWGPAAERLAQAKVPATRTDAYFDLANFVEKARDFAQAREVEIRPAAERFGFALYTNEGPELERVAAVFRQRLVAQYLVEVLAEARPRALLSMQREYPLTKAERDARAAAATAAETEAGPPLPSDAPDFFAIDSRASARVSGFTETLAFRLAFTGQTAALRAFLNKLASFELPVLVREIEVLPASGEDAVTAASTVEEATPGGPVPASIVLTVGASSKKSVAGATATKPAAAAPLIANPLSKFVVTVEFVDVIRPSDSPAENPAEAAKPGT